jgi:four helix bundle protein
MTFLFEKLLVYQKAVDFAVEIGNYTDEFPRRTRTLADQLNRAAISVPANIAEGNGRWGKLDRRNYFIIARGSLQECVALVEIATRRGCFPVTTAHDLKAQLEEIARMLAGLIEGNEHRASP